jgi:TRAP-type C4-dicarboxylate transport system permease large subunit
MLVLLLLALIAGMILDPLIPMIMPILLPSLLTMDVDLVHFGVLMVLTVVIGQITPPVALALLIAAQIGREDVIAVIRANTVFLIGLIFSLILLVMFPALSTWLPSQLL